MPKHKRVIGRPEPRMKLRISVALFENADYLESRNLTIMLPQQPGYGSAVGLLEILTSNIEATAEEFYKGL